MAIFGNRSTSSYVAENVGYIEPTAAGSDLIMTESAKESYQLRAGMYISDIMMEEAVIEGAATPEVLLEAFGKDVWAKIKGMFMKLWNKLKEWFNKVKRFFQILFTSGADFVKKFEKELRAKNVKGYKYKGFNFTIDKGAAAAEKVRDAADKAIVKYENGLTGDAVKSSQSQHDALEKGSAGYKAEYNSEDEKDEILKAAGGDSIAEVETELEKAFRNNEEKSDEIENFEGNSKEEMMSFIKDNKKTLETLDKAAKKLDTEMEKVIKAIESGSNKFKGDAYGKVAPYVSHSTEMIRFAVSVAQAANKVEVEAHKEAARTFESALKGYLHFKPAKEGLEVGDDLQGASSILESAMKFV